MSATLVAVVIALVLGHALPAMAGLRQYGWFDGWAGGLERSLGGRAAWEGWFGLLLLVLPPLLLMGLLQYGLRDALFGLPGFVLAVLVLFYAWGPRDLDVDVEAVVEARDGEARHVAAARLYPAGDEPRLDGPSLVGAVARGALRRWFGVLFWFLLMGPVGALGYRLVQLAADASLSTARPASARDAAGVALAVLEWPVAQLMTLALALVGNFDTVFAAWREARAGRPALDTGFLEAAARASVTAEIADDEAWATEGLPADAPPALLELRDAMSLVWRMLMVWLAVLALFVLAGWVG